MTTEAGGSHLDSPQTLRRNLPRRYWRLDPMPCLRQDNYSHTRSFKRDSLPATNGNRCFTPTEITADSVIESSYASHSKLAATDFWFRRVGRGRNAHNLKLPCANKLECCRANVCGSDSVGAYKSKRTRRYASKSDGCAKNCITDTANGKRRHRDRHLNKHISEPLRTSAQSEPNNCRRPKAGTNSGTGNDSLPDRH